MRILVQITYIWFKSYEDFTKSPRQDGQLPSKPTSFKNGWVRMPVVRNVDMHMYAKCYTNIPCDSRVMKIITNW